MVRQIVLTSDRLLKMRRTRDEEESEDSIDLFAYNGENTGREVSDHFYTSPNPLPSSAGNEC
jgi:hypothetical protein